LCLQIASPCALGGERRAAPPLSRAFVEAGPKRASGSWTTSWRTRRRDVALHQPPRPRRSRAQPGARGPHAAAGLARRRSRPFPRRRVRRESLPWLGPTPPSAAPSPSLRAPPAGDAESLPPRPGDGP
jgi:hypothetical protein